MSKMKSVLKVCGVVVIAMLLLSMVALHQVMYDYNSKMAKIGKEETESLSEKVESLQEQLDEANAKNRKLKKRIAKQIERSNDYHMQLKDAQRTISDLEASIDAASVEANVTPVAIETSVPDTPEEFDSPEAMFAAYPALFGCTKSHEGTFVDGYGMQIDLYQVTPGSDQYNVHIYDTVPGAHGLRSYEAVGSWDDNCVIRFSGGVEKHDYGNGFEVVGSNASGEIGHEPGSDSLYFINTTYGPSDYKMSGFMLQ